MVCSCGGEVKVSVVTKRQKRGRFLEVMHFTEGRCLTCKAKYRLPDREEAIRARDQRFFL